MSIDFGYIHLGSYFYLFIFASKDKWLVFVSLSRLLFRLLEVELLDQR